MGKGIREPKTEEIRERCSTSRKFLMTGSYTKYLNCFSGIMNTGNVNLEKGKQFWAVLL